MKNAIGHRRLFTVGSDSIRRITHFFSESVQTADGHEGVVL